LDGIGRVDIRDFAILADHWGQTSNMIVINEVMSNNNGTIEDPQYPGQYPDWIELYNPGSESVDIGGMYLTDTLSTPMMWQIPDNAPAQTTILPGGYLLIWADDDPAKGPLHVKFKLSAGSGEAVGLFISAGNPVDTMTFGSQSADESYGRYPNGGPGWQKFKNGTATPGSSNGGESADLGIVINEIMYHPGHNEAAFVPEPTQLEYIEIFNKGTSAVNLGGWRLVDGVSYTVPAYTLGAGNYLVIAADTAAFAVHYPTVTNVIGGWVGKLSNSGENVTLVNAVGTVIDSVHYCDEGDWAKRIFVPVDTWGYRGFEWSDAHDGAGYSLELINSAILNEYGQNWAASTVMYGTPGTANSAAQTQNAPFILDVKHTPLVPVSGQAVTVTARILDELATGLTVTLRWRVDTSTFVKGVWPTYNPASYTVVTMNDDGLNGDTLSGDGVYAGQIPAQANKAIVEFFIRAEDSSAHVRTYPAPVGLDGTDQQIANLLYQVDYSFDPQDGAGRGQQPVYRLIMTNAQRQMLSLIGDDTNTSEKYSNAQANCTFISIDGTETKLHYNVHSRDRGEGSRVGPPNNFRVNFRHDDTWKGLNAINLNSKYTWLQIAGSAVMKMADFATFNAKAVRLHVNGTELALTDMARTQGRYACLEAYDEDFIAGQFPFDPDGNVYKCVNYDSAFPNWTCWLEYLGTDPSFYTDDGYSKQTNTANADWSGLIALTHALDAEPDATYVAAVEQIVNVDQWMRWFAAEALIGNNETNLSTGRGDDYQMYQGVIDPRFILLPHDFDTCLGGGDSGFSPSTSIFVAADHTYLPVIERFLKHPAFVRKYYAYLLELMDTSFSSAKINPVLDEILGGFVPQEEINNRKQFIVSRNAYVLSQIPLTISVTTAVNATTHYIHTTTNTVSLAGRANAIDTRRVTVNGQPAVWTAWTATWTISNVALLPGVNRVLIQAFDAADKEIERSSVDVWYNTGTMTTKASGTLASDEVWTPQGGPYNITASLTIPAGRTLTIQPGTTVYLGSNINLDVADGGKIMAEGTQYQQIRFASVPGSGTSWGGLTIHGSVGSPETRIAYAFFEGNNNICIHTVGATLYLDHVYFGTTTRQYVSLDSSSFLISHCVFPKTTAAFEPMHGSGGIKTGGRGILRDSYIDGTSGYNDHFDFTGGNRDLNEPIIELYNNVFINASDDILDLDGTDAWIEGNIFMHCHRNNSPDSSSAISGGSNGTDTSQVTIIGNLFYDCDNAATAKQGNFFTMINNTIVRTTKTGGQEFDSGVVNVRDTTPDITTFAAGFYLEGNIIVDAEQLVRNYDSAQTTVTFNNNILPLVWTGPGSGNVVANPVLKHIPDLSETNFTSWEQTQVMWDWFSLQPGSAARGTGPNGADMGGVIPYGVSISGVPDSVTSMTDATLIVGVNRTGFVIPTAGFPLGSGFTHYQWRLDAGGWSAMTPISEPISLSGLAVGPHQVEAIGFNDAGRSQNDVVLGTNATVTTSAAWTVDPTIHRRLVINEVLASNTTLIHDGTYPDMIELYYDGPASLDLGGYQLTDNKDLPGKFIFAAGTVMNPGTYLAVYADTATTSGIHTGFALNADGDDVTLTDSTGIVVDSVVFGPQLPDKSVGRIGYDGQWMLTEPTFGSINTPAVKGDPRMLKINEWFTNGNIMFTGDWLEIYNPDTTPVDMGGLYVTDNPVAEPNKCPIRPLSFVAGSGFIKLPADGSGDITFKLSSDGGMIGLFDTDLTEIDKVIYTPQTTDVSQGRTPDGSDTLAFFKIPTPGVANPTGATTVYTTTTLILENAAKKVLVPTAAVAEAWKGGAAFSDSAWNSGTIISGKAGGVGYENNPGSTDNYTDLITYDIKAVRTGSCYIRVPFTLTAEQVAAISSLNLKIRRDDGFIAYINGVTAAQSNNIPATPAWNSYATSAVSSDTTARQLATYTITNTSVLSALKVGQNILAIHGMDATSSSDMIISFILEIVTQQTEGENTMAPHEALVDGLRITEIMYNPADNGNAEYIELQNIGSTTLNLEGVRLSGGVDFTFPAMTLAPGQYTLVIAQQAAFQARYGTTLNVAGVYTGKLSNAGEQIILKLANPLDAAILRFDYKNGWYPLTDGGGYSLVIVNPAAPAADWQDKDNWDQSIAAGGSPGRADTAPVIINEVLAHAHDAAPDWIELYNTTDAQVNIGGWTLSDDVTNLAKYRIADNTFIEPYSYLVFYENTHFGNASDPGSLVQFAFSENGDSAYLTADTGGYTTEVHFGASERGVSFGRHEKSDGTDDFVLMSSITPDDDNALPMTGPVVISEMMYNPFIGGAYPTDDYEYIELHNITASPVTLSMYDSALSVTLGWKFTAGIDFTFPITTSIPANGYLIVARNPAAFTTRYGSPAGVEILGPFENTTALSNDGERIELSKPGDTDLYGVRYYIAVDAVHYKDQYPWPGAPDGGGQALDRINDTLYGDDVTNWQSQPASPGI
jgi:hypothetical protein